MVDEQFRPSLAISFDGSLQAEHMIRSNRSEQR